MDHKSWSNEEKNQIFGFENSVSMLFLFSFVTQGLICFSFPPDIVN